MSARAQSEKDAEHFVEITSREIAAEMVKPSIATMRALLARRTDIKMIGRFALGKYARQLPEGLWVRYNDLLLNWMAGFFVDRAGRMRGKQLSILRSARRSTGNFIVSTQIVGGTPDPVLWHVVLRGAGYRIFDVNFSDVWLAQRMRLLFVDRLNQHKGNFESFLKTLE